MNSAAGVNGAAFDFGVAVERGGAGAGVAVFALEEVTQLDEVVLQGVGAALAVGVVVLAEEPVEQAGVHS
jgi:hypothetical protein